MPTITAKELREMKPGETYILRGLSGAQVKTVRAMANYANQVFEDGMYYSVSHKSARCKTEIHKSIKK